jgi:hypothetical protein
MSSNLAYFASLATALGLGFGAAWYLKSHLRGILVDLCGNEQRADFWIAFSNVVLILVPSACAMQFRTEVDETIPAILQLNSELKWVFVGLIGSVMSIGAILALFISREPAGSKSR